MRLTEVRIKKDAQTSTSHPKGRDKPPHFWHWKLEYPWQIEHDSTSTNDVAVYEQRCTERQRCQGPIPSASERLPLLEKAGTVRAFKNLVSYLDTGGAAQYASIFLLRSGLEISIYGWFDAKVEFDGFLYSWLFCRRADQHWYSGQILTDQKLIGGP